MTNILDFTKFLPEEVIFAIFDKLTAKDLCIAARVNSEWKRFCEDSQIWRDVVSYKEEFVNICAKRNISIDSPNDWKEFYRERTLINSRFRSGKFTSDSIFTGHTDTLFCIKIIDDNRLVTAGADATIRFWDISKQQSELVLQLHRSGILGLDYNAETHRLATGSFDGEIRVTNINFNRREKLSSFTVKELKEVLRNKGVDFSDCFEKSDLVRRIEVTRAIPVADTAATFEGHTGVVVGLHLQKEFLASGSRDCMVKVWNIETGKLAISLREHYDAVNAVWLYDGAKKLLSSSNDTSLKQWDVTTGKVIKSLYGHQAWVWGLQYDEPSSTIVSCSVDGTVRIWDIRQGNCVQVLANGPEVAGVCADFNSNRIVSSSFDSMVKLWDLRSAKFLANFTGHKDRCTRCDANENMIVSGSFDSTARLWSFV